MRQMFEQEKEIVSENLIAPCGMNCGVCSGYLAYAKGIPKKRGAISHCSGCRIRHKACAYLKGHCRHIRSENFCFTCDRFPCVRLVKLDQRYRTHYGVSLITNLLQISKYGLGLFIKGQMEQYRCRKCGGSISIHNRKCYDCELIEHWRGK